MRILLVSLPSIDEGVESSFPLGIGYLASALKPHHDVECWHFSRMTNARRRLKSRVGEFQPEIIGLTCSTFNRANVRRAIGWFRRWVPEAKVVVGGVHASYCYEHMLTAYGADAVVIGEGEQTIVELCSAWEQGRSLGGVNGIAYRDGNETRVSPPRSPVQNLDDLAMPDYSYGADCIRRSGMAFLITTRGCPVRCNFCSTSSFWGQRVRMHSPARVVDEMEALHARFGVGKLFFHDDTFNVNIGRVMAICDEILRRNLKLEWGCSCRVVPVSEEMLSRMVEAGCRHICWGVESGSERMLKSIEKRITLDQIRRAFQMSRAYTDIMTVGAFAMVGNPGETEETVRESVAFFDTLPMTDPPSASVLYVLPGTMLYETFKAEGKISDQDWLRYDTVPSYTVEHSMLKLLQWADRINRSGRRIAFDPQKRFWQPPLPEAASDSIAERLEMKWSIEVRKLQRFRKILPGHRLRF